MDVVPLEPRTFARTRQTDRQHHRPLAGPRRSWRGLGRRDFGGQIRGNLRFGNRQLGGGLGCFYDGGRSYWWPRTRFPTTSTVATTARRPRSSLSGGGRRRCREGFIWVVWLRFGSGLRLDCLRHRGNLGIRGGGCEGLVIVKSRLQGLKRLISFLCGAFSGFFAALQTLAHPFAHIAACSIPPHHGAIHAPWQPRYPGWGIQSF